MFLCTYVHVKLGIVIFMCGDITIFPHMSHSWPNPIEIIFSQLSFKKSVTSISPWFSLCHLFTFLLSISSLSSYHLRCVYTHMKHVHVCEATHAHFLIMLLTSGEVLSLGQLPSFIFHLLCSQQCQHTNSLEVNIFYLWMLIYLTWNV